MLTSFLTVVAAAAIGAPAEAPQWESDYGKALEQVRADDKPLLVVVEKPGQAVDEALMETESDGALQKYDLCRVDASTEYGQKVADAFKAKSFPYVAFIDKTGSVVLHSHQGKITESTWNSSLTKYQAGVKPHVVMKAEVESYPVQYESSPVHYTQPSSSYCPSCQKGF